MNASSLLAPCTAFLAAPALFGLINRVKAVAAGRHGQPVLQTYYDIAKLLRKGAVYSISTSWIFRIAAPLGLACTLAAVCLVPLSAHGAPLSFTGDIIALVYFLALARFAMVLASLDTASSFEGMGASREAFFSALAEPVLLVGLCGLARSSHGMTMLSMFGAGPAFGLVASLLIGTSLFVVLLAENARMPVDDPTTHLELTMIHEVMVLDSSGPDFAFVNYAASLKLWIFSALVVRVVLPLRPANPWLDYTVSLFGIVAVAGIVGVVESVMARLRLGRVPLLLVGAGALATTGLLFSGWR